MYKILLNTLCLACGQKSWKAFLSIWALFIRHN